MKQIVHHQPRGLHVPPKAFTPAQQHVNDYAAALCGIKPITEREWIDADLANNTGKTERHDAQALADQINYLSKVECDL